MKKAICILMVIAVAACNNPATVAEKQADTATTVTATMRNDTLAVPPDTAISLPKKGKAPANMAVPTTPAAPKYIKTRSPQGIYRTVLPCRDCKEIEHIVAFYPDNTYRIEEKRVEKDTAVFDQATGDWKPTDGVIWLYKEQVVRARYIWKGDTLQYLDPATKKTISLRSVPAATDKEAWKNKGKEGVVFFGTGNEPFWNIEIRNDNAIRFRLADKTEPVAFSPVTPLDTPDSTIYHIQNDSTDFKVAIYPRFCSDGMSDSIYPQKVSVHYKGQTYYGCGILYK